MGHKSQCSEAEKGAFKIASVLYSLCYLLAPELQNDFPITLPRNFVPDFKPVEINWARFVLWTLGRASVHARAQIRDGNKKIGIFGCTLLLQVQLFSN